MGITASHSINHLAAFVAARYLAGLPCGVPNRAGLRRHRLPLIVTVVCFRRLIDFFKGHQAEPFADGQHGEFGHNARQSLSR